MELKPIGVVRSQISVKDDMPVQGVDAEIEIFEEYASALDGIEWYSHIYVLCWLHEADRSVLKASPRKISPNLPAKGVFSMRSPSRPNPISLTPVRLYRRFGRFLFVANLDAIDKTPVIDIKPYQAGWDCIFSARNPDRKEKNRMMKPGDYQASLVREAINYHGERCVGLAVAVRMAMVASNTLDMDLRSDDVGLLVGKNACITDSLIGITGARMGTGRLLFNLRPKQKMTADSYSIFNQEKTIIFKLRRFLKSYEDVLQCDANDLFDIEVI